MTIRVGAATSQVPRRDAVSVSVYEGAGRFLA